MFWILKKLIWNTMKKQVEYTSYLQGISSLIFNFDFIKIRFLAVTCPYVFARFGFCSAFILDLVNVKFQKCCNIIVWASTL